MEANVLNTAGVRGVGELFLSVVQLKRIGKRVQVGRPGVGVVERKSKRGRAGRVDMGEMPRRIDGLRIFELGMCVNVRKCSSVD